MSRRSDRNPPEWALERLREERVGRLATADESGTTSIVPVCFVWQEGAVYSAIDGKPKSTRRLRRVLDIEHSARASLLLDAWHEDWSRLWWVLVRGRAQLLYADTDRAIAGLKRKYRQYESVGVGPEVIRLEPHEIRSWCAGGLS